MMGEEFTLSNPLFTLSVSDDFLFFYDKNVRGGGGDSIKIAICDDEENIRVYLSSLVRKQGRECEIAEYGTADEYLPDKSEYDLLFLDIELDGEESGMDGMELARRIRDMELERQPVIIFVTGYEKYVYDAFDVGAFQYLLKPIDEQRFAEVFGRAIVTWRCDSAAASRWEDKIMCCWWRPEFAVQQQDSCRRISFVKSRRRKSRTSGSVRGIPCKGYVYLTIISVCF